MSHQRGDARKRLDESIARLEGVDQAQQPYDTSGDKPWPEDSWPTAEQWVGWFVGRTPEFQQELAERIIRNAQEAATCFERNHEARLEQAERQVREIREGIAQAIEARANGNPGASHAYLCGLADAAIIARAAMSGVSGPTEPRHNHDAIGVYSDCPACGTVIPGPATEGASE